MRKVGVKEVLRMANDARDALFEKAASVGMKNPKVYLHWTAGHYNQPHESYHFNITGDGDIYASGDDLAEVRSHTWRRNTGSVGVALCGCWDADTNSLGSEPPTAKQIEIMAQVVAALCDGLWLTINKDNVMTHGEAAANEDGLHPHSRYAVWADDYGDGDVRWDLEYLGTPESPRYNPWATDGTRGGDVIRGKANWYRELWQKEGM